MYDANNIAIVSNKSKKKNLQKKFDKKNNGLTVYTVYTIECYFLLTLDNFPWDTFPLDMSGLYT